MIFTAVSLSGQRFTSAYLDYGWQLAPWGDLRAHPLSSVWYLHIQPPAWNLLLGVVGRWSPLPISISLQILMAIFGAVTAILLCDALQCVGASGRCAVVLASVSIISPDVLLSGFGATYELPVAALLVVLVWIVARGSKDARQGRWFLALAVVATLLTMTRTVFHPIWLLIFLMGVGWHWRSRLGRKYILAASLIPLLIVGGWMTKNKIIVDRFTLSTWSGMNLERAVLPVLPANLKKQMIANSFLSGVAGPPAFSPYVDYAPILAPCLQRATDPAVLRRPIRDGPGGLPNYNARCYLPAYDQAEQDALTVIRRHPDVYLKGRLWAGRVWFAKSDSADHSPSPVLRLISKAYSIGMVGVPAVIGTSDWNDQYLSGLPRRHFLLIIVACTVACIFQALRRRVDATYRVVGFLVLWTFTIGILFELGEQVRFRIMTDPITLAFGLLLLGRSTRVVASHVKGQLSHRRTQ